MRGLRVIAVFPTACERISGPVSSSVPVSEAQSAVTVWKARRGTAHGEKGTIRAKMSSLSNNFNVYTMAQLNEILEDDEKLTKMVQEMDEVR